MEYNYDSYQFELTSSNEVYSVLDRIKAVAKKHILIHIASYLHNTVLVHNLENELQKSFVEIDIFKIPNTKNAPTEVSMFTYNDDFIHHFPNDALHISSALLHDQLKHVKELDIHLSESKRELIRRFFTDSLTQLPNHYQLRNALQENEDRSFIIIHIDNFKIINDFYGFIVGDYLLEKLTVTIKALLKEGTTLYKTSGADFAILLEEKLDFYILESFLHDFSSNFKNLKYNYLDNDIYLDVTLASSSSSTQNDIFSKVSYALQYAKSMRLAFWIYEDQMQFRQAYENNLKISTKIRNAIENSGIVPYFQPIISNKTGKITKYECLSRLIDADQNIIAPNQFLPITKTIKVYNQVTKTIIEKSFEVFENHLSQFSINLSIDDIMNEEIYHYIINKLQNSNASSRVIFELLESEHIEDYQKVSQFITEVRRYGAKIAIDDFGSGFSNFSYLSKIRVDFLKIDGSLIQDIDTDMNAEIVVETIVSFAKRLGIQTIAEYVHSSTVLAKVKSIGIDYSQGFYIDEPQPKFIEDPKSFE